MNLQLFQKIRQFEIDEVIQFIPEKSLILEIGAGAGWQSKYLAEKGFFIEAIDIKASSYENIRSWPVTEYNGKEIPFPDEHFDIVFSSNVLEHIFDIEIFQKEIKRVLKSHGMAIHVLPTGTWCFWTKIIHYIHLATIIYGKIISNDYRRSNQNSNSQNQNLFHKKSQNFKKTNLLIKKLRCLVPPKHGELGNALSEIYLFSHYRWIKLFQRTGWIIVKYFPNKLFYTGHLSGHRILTINMRRKLSNIFGSSCIIYFLRK